MEKQQTLADLFDIEDWQLREVHSDFDGATELEFEDDLHSIEVEVVTYKYNEVYEEYGMDYDIGLYNIDVVRAYYNGSEVNNTREITNLIKTKYNLK